MRNSREYDRGHVSATQWFDWLSNSVASQATVRGITVRHELSTKHSMRKGERKKAGSDVQRTKQLLGK